MARAETTLPNGTVVTLELSGGDATNEVTRKGLHAAAAAVARWKPAPAAGETDAWRHSGIIGASEPMAQLRHLLDRIGSSNATVLIMGENGTGKELVARALHEHSDRASKKMVCANCSAFNDNLLESELFGHKRGAFTGAVADKPGLFEVADGGALFLDEVGDMSPALQAKLLRVLQEGVLTSVGGTQSREVDVRIIAATNKELSDMVKAGTFREDLFYRLHVVIVRVPALRDRPGDVPLLVQYFMGRLAARYGSNKALSRATLDRLEAHTWPGNVRELENEIERLWVLSGDDQLIDEGHLTDAVRGTGAARGSRIPTSAVQATGTTLPDAIASLERSMIAHQLQLTGGNKTRAAEALGISRRNLIRKVQTYNLDPPREGDAS